jgi:methyl-accepting chemotaxis protein
LDVGRVVTALAEGDLGQRVELRLGERPLRGEQLRTAKAVNGLATQLEDLTREVTRVAVDLGVNGRLTGTVRVRRATGTYADVTDALNTMLRNVGAQVRGIATAVDAVAAGDLSTKVPLVLETGVWRDEAETINSMIDMLREFSTEVTGVARAVGTEGRLGGPGAGGRRPGVWRDTVDQVNLLAGNLSSQVRDISSVARPWPAAISRRRSP